MPTKSPLLWPVPVRFPGLEADELHLWSAWLDDPAHRTTTLQLLLTSDELKRADRFHFERDRRRFIAGRAMLRQILAAYLEDEPASLRFVYGPHGKPALARRPGGQRIEFNLTHSGPLALFAFARSLPVGVDVEQVRELNDLELIAGQFFSPAEVDRLHRLDPEERRREFLRLWTQREAFGKARGVDLDQVLGAERALRQARVRPDSTPCFTRRWHMVAVRPADDFVGSVAHPGDPLRLCQWQWPSIPASRDAVRAPEAPAAWRATAVPAA